MDGVLFWFWLEKDKKNIARLVLTACDEAVQKTQT